MTGVEPAKASAWKADVLPLNYTHEPKTGKPHVWKPRSPFIQQRASLVALHLHSVAENSFYSRHREQRERFGGEGVPYRWQLASGCLRRGAAPRFSGWHYAAVSRTFQRLLLRRFPARTL